MPRLPWSREISKTAVTKVTAALSPWAAEDDHSSWSRELNIESLTSPFFAADNRLPENGPPLLMTVGRARIARRPAQPRTPTEEQEAFSSSRLCCYVSCFYTIIFTASVLSVALLCASGSINHCNLIQAESSWALRLFLVTVSTSLCWLLLLPLLSS